MGCGIPIIEAEYLNNPFIVQSFFTLHGSHYSLRASSFQDISNKLNLYGTSKSLFHKFYSYIIYYPKKISFKFSIEGSAVEHGL
jgi:hypothetical protein